MSSEIQQLSLAKQFVEEAELHLQRGDNYGNGQAVSLAQDAVELVIRAAVRHFALQIKPKASLFDMIEALDKHAAAGGLAATPHRVRVEDLNQARVSFKHFGTAPGSADARRLVRHGVEFAEVAAPQFFDIEWRSLSLADAIRDETIRAFVKAAEALLADGTFRDALVEAADAVRAAEGELDRLLPKARWYGSSDQHRGLAEYLNGLRLVSLGALVQFDVRALLQFRQLGVNVSRSHAGERYVTFTGSHSHSEEQAAFGVAFARDFSLAVQARLG